MVVIYMLLLVWHNHLDPGVKPRDDRVIKLIDVFPTELPCLLSPSCNNNLDSGVKPRDDSTL